MRRLPAGAALLVVSLAIIGAVLHPFSLFLRLLPIQDGDAVSALVELRTLIADLLGWALLGLLLVMAIYVFAGRRRRQADEALFTTGGPDSRLAEARSSQLPRVVVAITAYNDAVATANAVRDFYRQRSVVKVIVVDNNSTDQTAELAAAAGATVVSEPCQGYGYACIRGLAEGLKCEEADVVLLTEGDGTFVADDTPKFLTYIDHTDLVVGNRTVRGLVDPDSQMDHFFTWGNMAVAMLLRLRSWDGRFLGPAGLTDVGCTFRAIRREALARILPDLIVGGNHFSPHMLLVAVAHGLTVVEIPIRFRRRVGKSKGASRSVWSGFRVGLAMIWHILTFSLRPVAKRGLVIDRDWLIVRPTCEQGWQKASIEFVPGSAQALAELSRMGYNLVIISDQRYLGANGSGKVARSIDRAIADEVERRGGRVDAFIACTHGSVPRCSCRSPKPDLVRRAAKRRIIDPHTSIVVSDQPRFLQGATRLGSSTILIKTEPSQLAPAALTLTAPNLASVAELLRGGPQTLGSIEPTRSTQESAV